MDDETLVSPAKGVSINAKFSQEIDKFVKLSPP